MCEDIYIYFPSDRLIGNVNHSSTCQITDDACNTTDLFITSAFFTYMFLSFSNAFTVELVMQSAMRLPIDLQSQTNIKNELYYFPKAWRHDAAGDDIYTVLVLRAYTCMLHGARMTCRVLHVMMHATFCSWKKKLGSRSRRPAGTRSAAC